MPKTGDVKFVKSSGKGQFREWSGSGWSISTKETRVRGTDRWKSTKTSPIIKRRKK